MSRRVTLSYSSIFFLSLVFMMVSIVYFFFEAHTRWHDWRESNQPKRPNLLSQASGAKGRHVSQLGQASDENTKSDNTSNKPDNVETLQDKTVKEIKFSRETGSSESIDNVKAKTVNDTDGKKKYKNGPAPCAEGKIYVSNEFYDCDGIMKDTDASKSLTKDGVTQSKKSTEKTTVKQITPTLIAKDTNKGEKRKTNITANIHSSESEKNTNISKQIFVNCGGTFPWAIELFLDTYPNSSNYQIFTFLPDNSYKIMYSAYQNHTIITSEASYVNRTQNVDMKSFGSSSEITQSVVQTDLAAWLKTNTKQSDYVILRLESKEENKILKHLTESKAIEHIDKLYTSPDVDASTKDQDSLQTSLKQYKIRAEIWDNLSHTYSDFDALNPKHIPAPGKLITMCKQKKDEEKFALFLFSSSASVISQKVIKFLQTFSSEDRLPVGVFLPYHMFKSGLMKMEKLFETFQVGMYFDVDVLYNSSDVKFQYNLFKSKLTLVRHLFRKHGQLFQYVLAGNNTSNEIIASVQENLHYSVIQGGTDITHLSSNTLTEQTVSIDDTGKRSGDFLLVNIDTPNTEYLVLHMLRRFAPWLLQLSDCDIINTGDP